MATAAQLNDIQHRSDLSLSLYDLYKNKECCDITVCTTDPQSCDQIYSIECHKVVLVATSQYFRDVLLAGDDSSSLNMVDVGKGRIDIIREVLSFLYTGKCQVTSANIVELLRYSLYWKLRNLERLIIDLVANCLTVENVVEMYELALREGKESAEKESSMFLRKNFADVISSAQFKEISFTSLCKILKEDEIKIDSEDSIMRAVLMWLECNPQATPGVNDLWSVIRFEHLTARYLMKELLDHPLIQVEPQRSHVREALADICDNDGKSGSRGMCRYWGVKPVYDDLAKVTKDNKICVYDDEMNEWEQAGEVPNWVDRYTQRCIAGNTAVFMGTHKEGIDAGKCVAVDLTKMLIASSLPESNNDLNYKSVAQIGNIVYSIGGERLNNSENQSNEVQKLNLEKSTNKWEVIDCLPEAVDSPLVFAYKQLVYVIGGWNSKNEVCSINQMYDTNQSKWLLRTPAPRVCNSYYNGGFIHNNQIRVFTAICHMTYTIDTDTWTCREYNRIGKYIQPVLHGDQILACVRPELHADDLVCKSYNKDTNQWSDIDINVKDCVSHNMFFTFKL